MSLCTPGSWSCSEGRRLGSIPSGAAPGTRSLLPAAGSAPPAAGILLDRHDALPAGPLRAVVATARHGTGCSLGGRTAIVAAVPGCSVQERCGRRNFGTAGAVRAGPDYDRHGEDVGPLVGKRCSIGAGVAG